MTFETPLVLRPVAHRIWAVEYPFVAVTAAAGRIEVPAGFLTDLHSLPRLLWISSTPSEWPEAAVLHDWGYRDAHLPKAVADRVYEETLRALGVSGFRVWARVRALRWFGRYPSAAPVVEPPEPPAE